MRISNEGLFGADDAAVFGADQPIAAGPLSCVHRFTLDDADSFQK